MRREDLFQLNLAQKLDEKSWVQLAKMAEMGLSAASILHEVRQPLSALKMALQLMRHSENDPKATHDCLGDALEQTERLELLLGQMRNFLRPNLQGRSPVDLVQLVSGVLALLTRDLKSKQVEIVSHFEPGLDPVLLEQHKVEHILFNLIINARDAVLDSGGGRITSFVFKNPSGNIDVIIADNGVGVAGALRRKIFEPFFSTKDPTKGTGLGLYIAKRIAEQNNATLELLDEQSLARLSKDKFTTGFRLSFSNKNQKAAVPSSPESSDVSSHFPWSEVPFDKNPTTENENPIPERPTPVVDAAWPVEMGQIGNSEPDLNIKIILIEQNRVKREQLVGILLGLGCDVKPFSNAEEAKGDIENDKADVLIARPDVLKKHQRWATNDEDGPKRVRTTVAIMDRGGVDRAIEAIHLGARGIFSPPFEESKIALELRRAAMLPRKGDGEKE